LKTFDKEEPMQLVHKMELEIPDSIIKEIIEEFDCIKFLKESVKAKLMNPLKELDGKKTADCGTLHYGQDAPWAGTNKSHLSIMLFYEGKSAGGYAEELVTLLENGVNKVGLCPTGGKIRNISEITPDTIWKLRKNKFFHDFKKMLNIREGVDYTDAKNRAQLRYGMILYAGDADVDGIHICSLFFNMINVLYPSVLQSGMVSTYRTKILSAVPINGKKKKVFYELWQYQEWEKTIDISKWKVTYFKGLGSSTKEDVEEDLKVMFVVEQIYDEDADYYLNLFFGQDPKLAEKRRELIMAHDPESLPPPIEVDEETGARLETISSYLTNSYISYCSHTLVRHLSGYDGLNQVRRKVVYSSSIYWKDWTSDKMTRTVVFNGAATDLSNYHHGDSLAGVIVRMTQNFIGTNNLNHFVGQGQFGTREEGPGRYASIRYTSIRTNNWWLKLIYNPKDKPLLTHHYDEGIKTEPQFYLPRIPMCLVQGQDAIMCGWRSYVPPYNVLDICNWYVERINGKEPNEIDEPIPFFRGFKGQVEVVDTRKLKEVEELILNDNGEEVIDDDGNPQVEYVKTQTGKYSLVTRGIISEMDVNSLTIAELPVGIWTKPYLEGLTKMKSEGKLKNFYKVAGDYTTETPVIRVEGIVPKDNKNDPHKIKITMKDFPLVKSYPLNCMWLLGLDGKPRHYRNVTEILEEYYQWRLPYYEKRRLLELEEAEKKRKDCLDKVSYVNAVKDKKLIIIKRKKADILKDIRELGLREDLYGFTKYYDDETIRKLKEKAEAAENEYQRLTNTTDCEIMIEEIYELMDEYQKVYGDDRRE
jgi:DNA topoisomerase-2